MAHNMLQFPVALWRGEITFCVANHREEDKCMEQADEGGGRATCADHNKSIGSSGTLETGGSGGEYSASPAPTTTADDTVVYRPKIDGDVMRHNATWGPNPHYFFLAINPNASKNHAVLGGVEWEKKLAKAIPTCVSSQMKSPPKASSSTKQKKGRPVQAAAYIVADWVIPYRHKFALALKVWWELLPRALAHIREKEPNVMAVYTLVHNNRPDYEIERYVKLNFIHVGCSLYSKNHQVYAFFYNP
ncbi:hypothetical protein FOZ60_005002 [Perkinsus olseni]|uniref:Uncharacterized protein n=1 Tax=Perkinsus olseni TaxID=32597 RepID=A0A7J6NRY9_PEROL|nr:hypothetical protein FOZ60_005002 [Perkinsus olseni]